MKGAQHGHRKMKIIQNEETVFILKQTYFSVNDDMQ
jgi:hypothetical protein